MHHDASLNIRQLQVSRRWPARELQPGPAGAGYFGLRHQQCHVAARGTARLHPLPARARRLSLTEKGQQFLQQAIRVLSELNELERQSALLKGEHSGTLCISTLDSIETETALSLPVVLRSFSDKFPHVHIKLIIRTPAEQLNGVLNNHIDGYRQLQLAGA